MSGQHFNTEHMNDLSHRNPLVNKDGTKGVHSSLLEHDPLDPNHLLVPSPAVLITDRAGRRRITRTAFTRQGLVIVEQGAHERKVTGRNLVRDITLSKFCTYDEPKSPAVKCLRDYINGELDRLESLTNK